MVTHYVSRSAIEDDQTCPRKRFWRTVYGGVGLETNDSAEALIIGTVLHLGLEKIWKTGDIEQAINAIKALDEWTKLDFMWCFWAEAILRGYYRVRYKIQIKDWEPIGVEEEGTYRLGVSPGGRALDLLAKPDLVVRHRLTKLVRYKEAKTTRDISDRFIESWRKAVQLAAGQLVYGEKGIQIDQVQMIFFCKGEKADGYWRTPFLSAWRKDDHSEYAAARPHKWKGWERFNVWQSGMTPAEWVEKLSDDDISAELPETPELVFDTQLREDWVEQITYREGEIADAVLELERLTKLETHPDFTGTPIVQGWRRDLLNRVFPQHFKQCSPSNGYPCPFNALCWNPSVAAAPLASGLYRCRTPHHEIEAKALRGEE